VPEVTLDNLRYILDNRSGATNFLNVIQGQDAQQVDQWYAAVKDYPFEGWSMPIGRLGWSDGLRLLRRMLDEQKLDRTQWIHFLGIGTAHSAVAFSTIKRTLRSLLGSNALEISYDTSSPFQSMSRYELNAGFERRYIDRLSTPFQIDVRPSAEHIDSEEPFLPYQESPVLGGGIYGNDAYVAMGEMHLPKVKGKGARFDKLSLVLIAVHNIWSNLSAISDAHDRVEGLEATPRAKPFMGNSIPDLLDDIKKHYEGQQELKGAAGQIMALLRKLYEEEGIPSRLPHGGLNYTHNRYDNSVAELMEWSLEMNEIVREVLTSQTPDSVLEKNKKALSEFL